MGKIVYNGREYLSAGTASTMQGATSTTDGVSGLVPQPLIADRDKVLKGDGTWGTANEVTANPQDTPTDELTSIDIDGTVYEIIGGSAEIGKGPFIDTSNIIARYNASTYTSGTEITATEDIFVSFYITPGYATGGYFYINGVGVLQNWYEANSTRGYGYYVQKGQVFKIIYTPYDNDASRFGMIIYGLLDQGNGKDYYNPIIYSTEEREVGIWYDNRPLYQKTYMFNSLTNIPSGSWFNTGFTGTNMEAVGEAYGYYYDATAGVSIPLIAEIDAGTNKPIYVYSTRSASMDIHAFTIQYIKTTDAAGSGKYNTLGVPTVHYDGNEQVIGTYFGKTLYQKSWIFETAVDVSSSTWSVTPALIGDISKIISATANNGGDACWQGNLQVSCNTNGGNQYIKLQACRNTGNTSVKELTLQYIKSTT